MSKRIAILGATGSVGRQAIDVARKRGYRVDFLSAAKNASQMELFARELCPRAVAMADERAAADLKRALADTDIKVYAGEAGLLFGIEQTSATTVVNAVMGEAGLRPSLSVLQSGKRLALANTAPKFPPRRIQAPRKDVFYSILAFLLLPRRPFPQINSHPQAIPHKLSYRFPL